MLNSVSEKSMYRPDCQCRLESNQPLLLIQGSTYPALEEQQQQIVKEENMVCTQVMSYKVVCVGCVFFHACVHV
jgi:hypothetical protein